MRDGSTAYVRSHKQQYPSNRLVTGVSSFLQSGLVVPVVRQGFLDCHDKVVVIKSTTLIKHVVC